MSLAQHADVELEPGVSVGEWLFRHLNEHYWVEKEPWAVDRAARVVARLDTARPSQRPLSVVIPWLMVATAFTALGAPPPTPQKPS